jgi:hypothetical protein
VNHPTLPGQLAAKSQGSHPSFKASIISRNSESIRLHCNYSAKPRLPTILLNLVNGRGKSMKSELRCHATRPPGKDLKPHKVGPQLA